MGLSTDTFDHALTPDGRSLLQWNARWEVEAVDTATGISRYGAFDHTDWGGPAALRNLETPWPPEYRDDDLTNDPDFPVVSWAMAQKD